MPIKSFIRTVPDYPTPGIQFRDVTSLLEDARGLRMAVDAIVQRYTGQRIDYVAGIEARGFIFGTAVAYQLGVGFVPLRKAGKLPGKTVGQDYELEYGSDRIEMHTDTIAPDDRVVLIDDLIATGGTAEAAVSLIRSVGGDIIECCFVIDLTDLGGAARLEKLGCKTYSLCQFEGS
jgi:adenine phosphoribosyltransferase